MTENGILIMEEVKKIIQNIKFLLIFNTVHSDEDECLKKNLTKSKGREEPRTVPPMGGTKGGCYSFG